MEQNNKAMCRGEFTLAVLKFLFKTYQPDTIIRRKSGTRYLEMTTGDNGTVVEFVLGITGEDGTVIGKHFKRKDAHQTESATDSFPWVYHGKIPPA